jgi:hypothetical protein
MEHPLRPQRGTHNPGRNGHPQRLNQVKSLSPHHRFVIALHSPVKVTETGLRICRPEKGRQINAFRSRAVRSLQFTLLTKYCGIRACFAYFAAKSGAVSLQFRLAGGAGSLALTFLCPNSLLTGNLTGNRANSGALKPHFLSLSCTFQKETSGSGISPSREFAGMYQGIGFSYQRCVQRSSLRRQNS